MGIHSLSSANIAVSLSSCFISWSFTEREALNLQLGKPCLFSIMFNVLVESQKTAIWRLEKFLGALRKSLAFIKCLGQAILINPSHSQRSAKVTMCIKDWTDDSALYFQITLLLRLVEYTLLPNWCRHLDLRRKNT